MHAFTKKLLSSATAIAIASSMMALPLAGCASGESNGESEAVVVEENPIYVTGYDGYGFVESSTAFELAQATDDSFGFIGNNGQAYVLMSKDLSSLQGYLDGSQYEQASFTTRSDIEGELYAFSQSGSEPLGDDSEYIRTRALDPRFYIFTTDDILLAVYAERNLAYELIDSYSTEGQASFPLTEEDIDYVQNHMNDSSDVQ